ncbi:MAG: hypothetical protein J7L42_02940, partial [Elusimicrobia bacterium]|nr:hypothetical protein [Elusimicrobiota bacterium]
MKNFLRGIFLLSIVSGYVFAWNITGKIANWDPDTGGPFMVLASTDSADPGGSMVSSTTVNIAPNSMSTYTLTVLSNGTYYVFALLDLSPYNGQPDPNEPSGSYQVFESTSGKEEPVVVLSTDVPNIDFVCTSNEGPYLLKGLVTDNSNNPLGASVIYEKWSTPNNSPPNTGDEVFKDTICFSVVSAGNPQYIPDYNWEILVSTSEVGYNGEYQSVFFSADGYHEVMTWLKFDSSTDTPSGKFIKTVLFPVQAGDQITLFFDKDGFDFSDNLYRYWDSGADLNYTAAFGIPYRLEAITGTIKDEGAITLDQVTDFDHTGIIDNSTEPVAGHSYTFLSLEGVPTAIEVQEIGNDYVKFIYKYDYLSTATAGGNITGTISYSGTQTGDLYIMVGHGEP